MEILAERLENLSASDVMSPQVITVNEHDSLETVVEKFHDHQISGAAVVDNAGELSGIISMSDLVSHRLNPRKNTVRDRMTRQVVSVTKYASLIAIARVMCDSHKHRMPVVDGPGRLVGMITTMDVLSALVHAADESEGTREPQS